MALLLSSLATGLLVGSPVSPRYSRAAVATMGLHELTAKTMSGNELAMSSFAGKQVLALNVASR